MHNEVCPSSNRAGPAQAYFRSVPEYEQACSDFGLYIAAHWGAETEEAWRDFCRIVEHMNLNDREFSLIVRRGLLNDQLRFFTSNMERLYLKLQQQFGLGSGTAGTHMSLLEMVEEFRRLQAEDPVGFKQVFPPDLALRVDRPGPAKDHFDEAVKQYKEQAARQATADARRAAEWTDNYDNNGGAAGQGRASGATPGSPSRVAPGAPARVAQGTPARDAPGSPARPRGPLTRGGGDTDTRSDAGAGGGGSDRATGEELDTWRAFPDHLRSGKLSPQAMRDMMSTGVFRKGIRQLEGIFPKDDRSSPCLGFLCHSGCGKSGRTCRLAHHTNVPAAKTNALVAAAQLLAIQRGGWASSQILTTPQMRERWHKFACKSGELGPEARDNFGGGRDGAAAECGRPLRCFHKYNPPPGLAECDPAFMQALEGVGHPGERDLCAELLGQGRLLVSVEPASPTLRPTAGGSIPPTRAAHFAEEARRHLPTLVAQENGFFQAAAAQKAVEIALEAEVRPGTGGGSRPAWRDTFPLTGLRPGGPLRTGTLLPAGHGGAGGICVLQRARRRRAAAPDSGAQDRGLAPGRVTRRLPDRHNVVIGPKVVRAGDRRGGTAWGRDDLQAVRYPGVGLRRNTAGGMGATRAEINGAVDRAYAAVQREGYQCWAVFKATPDAARCNFLQARESAFDLAHFRDNNISLPMYFATDHWRNVRFIVIKVDRLNHVAMDVIDGVEFSVHSPRASVLVVLLYVHHLRPAYQASGTMTPMESEAYILDAESRLPHKPSVPVSRLKAVGWIQFARYPDTSVWAYGRNLGQDEITGTRVRLASLDAPDVAGGRTPPGSSRTTKSGGRPRPRSVWR